MSTELRQLGCTSLFFQSDSSLSRGLRVLGCQLYVTHRTGSNTQNTEGVRGAGPYLLDQASSLLKADGARSMTPKRSRQHVLTTSGLPEVSLEQ